MFVQAASKAPPALTDAGGSCIETTLRSVVPTGVDVGVGPTGVAVRVGVRVGVNVGPTGVAVRVGVRVGVNVGPVGVAVRVGVGAGPVRSRTMASWG